MSRPVELVCVGLNHTSAPVELREKVAFSSTQIEPALQQLRALPEVREAVVLSTCNRVELYVVGERDQAPAAIADFLHRYHELAPHSLDEHLVYRADDEAAQHLLRVASALDAIVVGEPQILGQVKDAYFRAAHVGTVGAHLNRVFHRAFFTAKRVRTETRIASSAVSVSYAGVELARKIFGDLTGLQVLLVGAGEMGELAARHFAAAGARLFVANRAVERAQRLAEQLDASARAMHELPGLLEAVDVVLVATGAPGYVVTAEMARRAARARRYRPLFLVDIAVPRNVEPAIGQLENFYVYDVDDLGAVVEENLAGRQREAARAEEIVQQEVVGLRRAQRELAAVPLIKAMREKLLAVAAAEAEKTLAVLGDGASDKHKRSVTSMAQAIVNKVLHEPTVQLRAAADDDGHELLAAAARLFGIELDDADATDSARVLAEAEAADSVGDDVKKTLLPLREPT